MDCSLAHSLMSPRPSEALPGFQLATPRDSTFDSRARPHGRATAYKACRTEAAAAAGRGESGARSVRWFAQCQILVSLAIRLVSRPSPIAALPRRSVPSQSPCSSNLLIKCLPTLLSVLPICCSLSTGVSIGFALVDRPLPLRRNASRAQGHRRPPGRSPPAHSRLPGGAGVRAYVRSVPPLAQPLEVGFKSAHPRLRASSWDRWKGSATSWTAYWYYVGARLSTHASSDSVIGERQLP